MKFLTTCKDGGPESRVWAHVLVEIKSAGSIILLRFEDGSREAYHSHAFNCFSWVLSGCLLEQFRPQSSRARRYHLPGWLPFITRRTDFHKVSSIGRTWVLTFRGPWSDTWQEEVDGRTITLTHGRKEIS